MSSRRCSAVGIHGMLVVAVGRDDQVGHRRVVGLVASRTAEAQSIDRGGVGDVSQVVGIVVMACSEGVVGGRRGSLSIGLTARPYLWSMCSLDALVDRSPLPAVLRPGARIALRARRAPARVPASVARQAILG